tara:strand:+ start:694 stop:1542 length:849 start_codon:yes stop_codon:yes gene_type:complete
MNNILIVFNILYSLNVLLLSQYHNLNSFYFVTKNKLLINEITNEVKDLYKWNNKNVTKHYWVDELNINLQQKINIINDEIIENLGDEFKNVRGMDEIYYSTHNNKNSDLSFVNTHTDGPLYYCSVYRGLIVLQGNKNTNTILDSNRKIYNLQKYDILLFDYNNNLHYIETNNIYNDTNNRILIKLHYVKDNNFNCGNMNIKYNKFARDLFNYNKYILNLSGKMMLFGQIINSFRVYFFYMYVCLYLLKMKLKNNKTIENMLTILSILPLSHLYFIIYINYFM